MTTSLFRAAVLATLCLVATLTAGCRSAQGDTPAAKRASVLSMRSAAMDRLYNEKPGTKAQVESSAGYAAFSQAGFTFLVAGGKGYGVVHDNASGQDTYMSMGEFGVGVGLGVQDTRIVIVFRDAATLHSFTDNGWQWGADADASAKSGSYGGAANAAEDVNRNMEVFVMTKSGIAVQASVTGTKYWKDEELNNQ